MLWNIVAFSNELFTWAKSLTSHNTGRGNTLKCQTVVHRDCQLYHSKLSSSARTVNHRSEARDSLGNCNVLMVSLITEAVRRILQHLSIEQKSQIYVHVSVTLNPFDHTVTQQQNSPSSHLYKVFKTHWYDWYCCQWDSFNKTSMQAYNIADKWHVNRWSGRVVKVKNVAQRLCTPIHTGVFSYPDWLDLRVELRRELHYQRSPFSTCQ